MHPTPRVCVCRKLQVLPRVTLRWAASLRCSPLSSCRGRPLPSEIGPRLPAAGPLCRGPGHGGGCAQGPGGWGRAPSASRSLTELGDPVSNFPIREQGCCCVLR